MRSFLHSWKCCYRNQQFAPYMTLYLAFLQVKLIDSTHRIEKKKTENKIISMYLLVTNNMVSSFLKALSVEKVLWALEHFVFSFIIAEMHRFKPQNQKEAISLLRIEVKPLSKYLLASRNKFSSLLKPLSLLWALCLVSLLVEVIERTLRMKNKVLTPSKLKINSFQTTLY